MPEAYGDTIAPPERREPPYNLEVEQALLGTLMQSPRAYDDVAAFLRPEHFANALHGRIFEACGDLLEARRSATPVTLRDHLREDPLLTDAGGPRYLAQLVGAAVTLVNAGEYGRIIHDLAQRRQILDLLAEADQRARSIDVDTTARDIAASIVGAIEDVVEDEGRGGDAVSLQDALEDTLRAWAEAKAPDGSTALSTSLRDLDKRLRGGLRPGRLYILAGRPSMGKTAISINIAFRAAKRGINVLFESLEMPAGELTERMVADEASVDTGPLAEGTASPADERDAYEAAARIQTLPLWIRDTRNTTVADIRLHARAMKRSRGLDLLVIDYLQLMREPGRTENRTQEISRITGALKELAKELGIPILLLSQLSRDVEKRDDKRPMMSDLRDSGSIEQDADVVMFVYREQYYLERSQPARGPSESDEKYLERERTWLERCTAAHNTAEVIVAKNRAGTIGTVKLYCDLTYQRFTDLAANDAAAGAQTDFGGHWS